MNEGVDVRFTQSVFASDLIPAEAPSSLIKLLRLIVIVFISLLVIFGWCRNERGRRCPLHSERFRLRSDTSGSTQQFNKASAINSHRIYLPTGYFWLV